MLTADEKITEIRKRESKIRHRHDIRVTAWLSVLSCAVMAVFVVALMNVIPSVEDKMKGGAAPYYGTVFAANPKAGFAVIIVLSFALGVCVSLLGIRIRKNREGQDEDHKLG